MEFAIEAVGRGDGARMEERELRDLIQRCDSELAKRDKEAHAVHQERSDGTVEDQDDDKSEKTEEGKRASLLAAMEPLLADVDAKMASDLPDTREHKDAISLVDWGVDQFRELNAMVDGAGLAAADGLVAAWRSPMVGDKNDSFERVRQASLKLRRALHGALFARFRDMPVDDVEALRQLLSLLVLVAPSLDTLWDEFKQHRHALLNAQGAEFGETVTVDKLREVSHEMLHTWRTTDAELLGVFAAGADVVSLARELYVAPFQRHCRIAVHTHHDRKRGALMEFEFVSAVVHIAAEFFDGFLERMPSALPLGVSPLDDVLGQWESDVVTCVRAAMSSNFQQALIANDFSTRRHRVKHVIHCDDESKKGSTFVSRTCSELCEFLDEHIMPLLARVGGSLHADLMRALCENLVLFVDSMGAANRSLAESGRAQPLHAELATVIFIQGRVVEMETGLLAHVGPDQKRELVAAMGPLYEHLASKLYTVTSDTVELHVEQCRLYLFGSLQQGGSTKGWGKKRAVSLFEVRAPSSAILAWNLYLKGLAMDVNSSLPRDVADLVFMQVLMQSALALLSHYVHIAPSRAKLTQYKVDLLCTIALIRSFVPYVMRRRSSPDESVDEQVTSPVFRISQSLDMICAKFLMLFVLVCGPDEVILQLLSDGDHQSLMQNHLLSSSKALHQHTHRLFRDGGLFQDTQCALLLHPAVFDPVRERDFNPVEAIDRIGGMRARCADFVSKCLVFEFPWKVMASIVGRVLSGEEIVAFVSKRVQLRADDYPPLTRSEIDVAEQVKKAIDTFRKDIAIADDEEKGM